jgi:hypothetical protein
MQDINLILSAGPTIVSISPSLFAGGSFVPIVGTGFGHTDFTLSASFGATFCDSLFFVSDSRIDAKIANGVGKHIFQLNVSGQYATISAAYMIPILTKATPGNFPHSSSMQVQVAGILFGTFDSCVKVNLATTHCESTRWQTSSSIRCKISRGFGTAQTVEVTVGSQFGSLTSAVSFDHVSLSSISPVNAPCFLPGNIFLFGKGFGFSFLDTTVAVGASAATGSSISSDSAILSNIFPGTGLNLIVSLSVASYSGSMSNVFSYDGP